MENNSKIILLNTTPVVQTFTWKNNVLIRSITISKAVPDSVSFYFDGQYGYQGATSSCAQGVVLHQQATYGLFLINRIVKDITYSGGTNNHITIEFEELKS